MIKTTFRIIKDKSSGANNLSEERNYLNKVWVDRDELVKMLFTMREMVLDQKPSDFRSGNVQALNNVLKILGVDE